MPQAAVPFVPDTFSVLVLWRVKIAFLGGVHFNIRLKEDRQCILVLMGVTNDGKKELIAVLDGFRDSEPSSKELLLDVKSGGLKILSLIHI